MTNEEFINKAKSIHGNSLIFEKTFFNGNWKSKVIVTCPIHGDLEVTAKHLIYDKSGCKYCNHDSYRKSKEEIIKQIKEIHGDKYGLDKIVYKNNKTPIILTCPIHGDFEITTQSIFRQKAGCKLCGRESMKKKMLGTAEKFIQQAKEIFKNEYDYSYVNYKGNKVKVILKCNRCGNFFPVTPNNHITNKSGCPFCAESKQERQLMDFLKEYKFINSYEMKFEWLKNTTDKNMSVDFYLPEYNIAIECQGEQHFKSVEHFGGEIEFEKRKERDSLKKQLCEEHGIKILYYSNLKDYNEFLGEPIYHTTEELLEVINQYKSDKEIEIIQPIEILNI